MVNYKLKDGSYAIGELIYINDKKDIGIGVFLDKNFILFYNNSHYYKINKNTEFYIGLLPLLEINVDEIRNDVEQKIYDFYDIVPVEKIILTAFSGEGFNSFSIYWKELALNWIEDLKLDTPKIMYLLNEKSQRDYKALPIKIKTRMRKIKLQLLKS